MARSRIPLINKHREAFDINPPPPLRKKKNNNNPTGSRPGFLTGQFTVQMSAPEHLSVPARTEKGRSNKMEEIEDGRLLQVTADFSSTS